MCSSIFSIIEIVDKSIEAKKEIIKLIKLRSNYSLRKSTLLREEKLNILMWKAMELC